MTSQHSAHGLAIVAALSVELAPVRRMLRGASIEPIAYCQSGPGPRRAADAVARLLSKHGEITEVLHLGYAGGLNPDLVAGQTRRFTRLMHEQGGTIELEARGDGCSLLSVDHVVAAAEHKSALFERFEADAVDTESFTVARVVHEAGRRYTAIRAISDEARHSLPESIEQWVTPAGKTRPLKAVMHLARHPWDLGPMIWMQRRSTLASRGLANAALAHAARFRSRRPPR